MKILLTYPGPTHSTYDVATGYQAALSALGVTVHAYDYHQYLKFYQAALMHWPTKNKDYRYAMSDVLYWASQHLLPLVVDFRPDALLIVGGTALHKRAFDLVGKVDVPIFLMLTESPYRDATQIEILKQGNVEHAFTNERRSVDFLSEAVPTTYLPHSFNPAVHRPRNVGKKFKSTVFFHGTMWEGRREMFDGLDVPGAIISGCNPDGEDRGRVIENGNLARFYAGADIALNYHRQADDADSIGPRLYEAAACGCFQLCDAGRAELGEVFPGSVPTYESREELEDKIEFYSSRKTERGKLAAMARQQVQDCSFLDRAARIVLPKIQEVLDDGPATSTRI